MATKRWIGNAPAVAQVNTFTFGGTWETSDVITLTIGSMQAFVMPYVLFRNERGQKAAGDMYNLFLYDNAFVYQRMGYASAMAWVQLLIVMGLTGLMFLTSRRLVYYRTG